MIWFNKKITLKDIMLMDDQTMSKNIGIEWEEIGEDFLKASMPVDHRTIQPYGQLHGGASCVLAETVGSVASVLVVDPTLYLCVGIEINANHIRSVREGLVHATCKPIHLGKSTHVWDIRIDNDKNELICVSRLTIAVLKRKDQS